MHFTEYMLYLVSTGDTDGLVLWHKDISSYNGQYAPKRFQLFKYGLNDNIRVSHKIDTLPLHDDVIKWKHFPRYWPFVRWIPHTKASDVELWCLLWSAPE